jgi:hypothetical protein
MIKINLIHHSRDAEPTSRISYPIEKEIVKMRSCDVSIEKKPPVKNNSCILRRGAEKLAA